jgi:ATP-binding cassette subfamily C (CFTR/MRP) protein 1
MAPLSCFIIFSIQASVNGSGRLTAGQTFSSLAIISLLTGPASDFLQSLPQIGMGTGCMERIQAFLLSEPRQDDRTVQDPTTDMSSERIDAEIELRTMNSSSLASPAIIVRDLQVRPSTDSPIVLHGLNFRVNRGSLVMLVGTVGAGKSTLLKSLVGELKFEGGGIRVATKNMAYCSQSPWLPNATVRKIVCGTLEHEDLEWYRTVLHACAFDQDILDLPNNDDTEATIGELGIDFEET